MPSIEQAYLTKLALRRYTSKRAERGIGWACDSPCRRRAHLVDGLTDRTGHQARVVDVDVVGGVRVRDVPGAPSCFIRYVRPRHAFVSFDQTVVESIAPLANGCFPGNLGDAFHWLLVGRCEPPMVPIGMTATRLKRSASRSRATTTGRSRPVSEVDSTLPVGSNHGFYIMQLG